MASAERPAGHVDTGGHTGERVAKVPASLAEFLRDNGLPANLYSDVKSIPRFIRFGLRHAPSPEDIKALETELGTSLDPTPIPLMYQLREDRGLVGVSMYKQGKIFGIDLASAFAVYALDIKPGMSVVDVCCAPGAKLCMMAELVAPEKNGGNQPPTSSRSEGVFGGTVTGVDISRDRLAVCRNILRKYKVMSARLFHCDGTTFNVPPPTSPIRNIRINSVPRAQISRKRKHDANTTNQMSSSSSGSSMLAEEQEGLAQDSKGAEGMYERVLVDAECTHDGSIKHMLKYKDKDWKDFETKVLVPDRLQSLSNLQYNLLKNGFRLLKPGGVLVYSTCSFCKAQNEEIVSQLLDNFSSARLLQPPPLLRPSSSVESKGLDSQGTASHHKFRPKMGLIENTLRFDPISSHTSGLFIARITKHSKIDEM